MIGTHRLTLDAVVGLPLVGAGDDLAALLAQGFVAMGGLTEGDVVVLAQKVVSKAEGRMRTLADVVVGTEACALAERTGKDPALVQLILDESQEVLRATEGVLIVRHKLGHVLANAGIDQSNVDHSRQASALLLPQAPDESAERLRSALKQHFGVSVGVVIADSFGRAWRTGTTGACIGAAGIAPLLDLRGEGDLFGRPLMVSQQAIGDEIASAASLLMGQGREGVPAVRLRGLGMTGRGATGDLIRPLEQDLFR